MQPDTFLCGEADVLTALVPMAQDTDLHKKGKVHEKGKENLHEKGWVTLETKF